MTFAPTLPTRHLNREAWLLFQITSLAWLEKIALASEALARESPTEWKLFSMEKARTVRLCADAIRRGNRVAYLYLQLCGALETILPDTRGDLERGVRFADDAPFALARERLLWCAEATRHALANNVSAGVEWGNGDEAGSRDKGIVGDASAWMERLQANGFLVVPDRFPDYAIDRDTGCRPGEPCPSTGIWIPSQGIDCYSLAFGIEQRPMQPAFEIQMQALDDGAEEGATRMQTVTIARDTVWHRVVTR